MLGRKGVTMPRARRSSITQSTPDTTVRSNPPLETTTTHVAHDLQRLGWVLLVTLALLAVAVWTSHTSDVLQRLGASLYEFLNL